MQNVHLFEFRRFQVYDAPCLCILKLFSALTRNTFSAMAVSCREGYITVQYFSRLYVLLCVCGKQTYQVQCIFGCTWGCLKFKSRTPVQHCAESVQISMWKVLLYTCSAWSAVGRPGSASWVLGHWRAEAVRLPALYWLEALTAVTATVLSHISSYLAALNLCALSCLCKVPKLDIVKRPGSTKSAEENIAMSTGAICSNFIYCPPFAPVK